MRLPSIAGLVLLVVGIVLFVQGGTFSTRREVLDVGGLRVTATEKQSVAPWLAGGALIAGVALVVFGLRSNGPRARF